MRVANAKDASEADLIFAARNTLVENVAMSYTSRYEDVADHHAKAIAFKSLGRRSRGFQSEAVGPTHQAVWMGCTQLGRQGSAITAASGHQAKAPPGGVPNQT